MNGAEILADSLRHQGVEYAFGIVGYPVIEVGFALQQAGIHYVAMRNEQSAAYAAQAMGYLSGKPAVCLAVSGPGVLHAVAGLANARVNHWPMILIGGASDLDQESRGAFQEWPQVASCQPYCKYAARVTSLRSIPTLVEKAVRTCVYGTPGPCYLDVPGNFVLQSTDDGIRQPAAVPLPPPVSSPTGADVRKAAGIFKRAKRPLLIVGKGSTGAHNELRALVDRVRVPFLPTPMGKGVVPDDHPCCVAAARSFALSAADVILLCGARLDWMLHFGLPPRFAPDVKLLLVGDRAEECHQNVPAAAAMLGDARLALDIFLRQCAGFNFDPSCQWWLDLNENCDANKQQIAAMADDSTVPLNYYAAYKPITERLPRDAIIINEGANTMDIGRSMLPNYEPRRRLDAATFGTMGVGLGSAIAAALHARSSQPVIAVLGDSAFGFSGMELETVARYKLPIVFVVINNNGIYRGLDSDEWQQVAGAHSDLTLSVPPLSLSPDARYDLMAAAFGGDGYLCRTQAEIAVAFDAALAGQKRGRYSLLNVLISPSADRKPQPHHWLTRSNL